MPPFHLFKGRILEGIHCASKLTGRGDDLILTFDRLALGNQLVLCDYWLIPFKNAKTPRRFENWNKSFKKWRNEFIGQRLKAIKISNFLILEFTNNVILLANMNFISIYNRDNQCIFTAE